MKAEKGLAIITGASRGIGEAVSRGLAMDGYRVVLISRSRPELERIKKEICAGQGVDFEPLVLACDITDYAELDEGIRALNSEYGIIDVFVNSAATFMDGSTDESVENYKKIVDVNLVASYAMLKTVVEIMKIQGSGYIFNIASRAGKYGFPGGGIYGSTKFALAGLSESLYRELAPLGIRVTTLCPGWVNTRMAKEAGTVLRDEEMIQPEDLFLTIRYLLGLSKNACVKEIVLEMKKSVI
jgi:short-subunit dehydrogenase